MIKAIKAIETSYNGYRFRSRLEARWAVFFDTLGIKYEYEKEGFDLGGVWYLPDFRLPELNCWVEIKGEMPRRDQPLPSETRYLRSNFLYADAPVETKKGLDLASASISPVYIFIGNDFAVFDVDFALYPVSSGMYAIECDTDGSYSAPWVFAQSPSSLKFELVHYFEEINHHPWSWSKSARVQLDSPRLITAYTAARQARFERGGK